MVQNDMSPYCGLQYENLAHNANNKTEELSDQIFEKYFEIYCGQCEHMCEICMYGEK